MSTLQPTYRAIWRGSLRSMPRPDGTGGTDSHFYDFEIYRYSEPTTFARTLRFDAEEPAVIEWEECRAEDCIQGSRCTLKVESPTDRAFVDLFDYDTDTGPIQLRIKRDGAVWWRGVLDTTLYEEPYESLNGYITTLVFTDFGAFDRIDYDRTDSDGLLDSLERILARGIALSGLYTPEETEADRDLKAGRIPASWLTTYARIKTHGATESRALTLKEMCCASSNFIDEEGEPCTMREAAEALLKAAGLRLAQRAGALRISDLDSLAEDGAHGWLREIYWTGNRQNLTTGETYNNITLRFSPYILQDIPSEELELDGENHVIQERTWKSGGRITTSPSGPTHPDTLAHFDSFRMRTSAGCTRGLQNLQDPSVLYYEIEPLMGSARESRGVTIDPRLLRGMSSTGKPRTALMTVPFWLPPATDSEPAMLRISMDLMLDTRYNPFERGDMDEDANYDNSSADYEEQKKNTGWLFVPCRLVVRDGRGQIAAYYDNSACVTRLVRVKENFAGAALIDSGEWVVPETRPADAPLVGKCWLEWYPDTIDAETTAADGFATNRPAIGRFPGIGKIPQGLVTRRGSGMLVPYPPVSGTLELTVYADCMGYRPDCLTTADTWDGPRGGAPVVMSYPVGGATLEERHRWTDTNFQNRIKWFMMEPPVMELVDRRTGNAFTGNDISYEAVIMASAKEELTVDTTVGTLDRPTAAARGLWRDSEGNPVESLTRNNVTASPEKMLIGTLYSQYRRRRYTLSGEALTTPGVETAVTDAASPGRLFRIERERADLRRGVSEITAVELFQEVYVEKIKKSQE